MGGGSHGSLPPIRALRASSQASRAAGASRGVAADAPPGESRKCRTERGRAAGSCWCGMHRPRLWVVQHNRRSTIY